MLLWSSKMEQRAVDCGEETRQVSSSDASFGLSFLLPIHNSMDAIREKFPEGFEVTIKDLKGKERTIKILPI
jgi:hypothetical protein